MLPRGNSEDHPNKSTMRFPREEKHSQKKGFTKKMLKGKIAPQIIVKAFKFIQWINV